MEHPRSSLRLPELMIVIVVIGMLFALLLPTVQKVRINDQRSESGNNLRQLGLACHNCYDTNRFLPPLFDYYPEDAAAIRGGKSSGLGPTLFHLLPFIEQDPLYNATKVPLGGGWCHQYDQPAAMSQPIKTFINPGDPSAPPDGLSAANMQAVGCYAANALVFGNVDANGNLVMAPLAGGVFTSNSKTRIPATFRDGTTSTILFTEKYAECNSTAHFDHGSYWNYPLTRVAGMASFGNTYGGAYPSAVVPPGQVGPTYGADKFQVKVGPFQTAACNPALAQSPWSSGILVSLGDASVRLVGTKVSRQTWMAASTPDQGDGLGSDW